MNDKYWFISYCIIDVVMGQGIRSILFNELIDINPFEWLKNFKIECNPKVVRLYYYTEITKDVFEYYKEMIKA